MPENKRESLSAAEVVDLLGLTAHPEGGFYRETFRDVRCDANGRAYSSSIYFLLRQAEISAWHRIDAVEVWHYYAGAPLLITISAQADDPASFRLGPNLAASERPQCVVPAGAWQKAQSLGEWTLVGCTVSPAFEFAKFELAGPDHQLPIRGSAAPILGGR